MWSIGGSISQDNLITDCTVEHRISAVRLRCLEARQLIRNCVALDVSYRSALNISTNHSTKLFCRHCLVDSVTIPKRGINERSWPSVWFGGPPVGSQ